MKSLTKLALAAIGLSLATPLLQAEEIVIYKFSSNRAWTEYQCVNPESATPSPRQKVAGSFPLTEYWIEDRTNGTYTKITYYTDTTNGSKRKLFSVYEPQDYSSLDPSFIDSVTYPKVNIQGKTTASTDLISEAYSSTEYGVDTDDDGFPDYDFLFHTQTLLSGAAKPLTVKSPLIFQKVASSATGEAKVSYIQAIYSPYAADGIYQRTIYNESGAASLKLDSKLTVQANTGPNLPSPEGTLTNSTVPYAVQLIANTLDKLGYDNDFVPPTE